MTAAVLIIDDDPILGPVTVELLNVLGHEAIWVDTYERGFDTLRQPHQIAIVLLDLQLGLQRGEALIEELRREGASLPPLLIFSAQPMNELRNAAVSVRAAGILQKPCDAATINSAIATAVGAA
jgi:DNA-binding response OmpR family regulator